MEFGVGGSGKDFERDISPIGVRNKFFTFFAPSTLRPLRETLFSLFSLTMQVKSLLEFQNVYATTLSFLKSKAFFHLTPQKPWI